MKISRNRINRTFILSTPVAIEELLKKYGMSESKAKPTPATAVKLEDLPVLKEGDLDQDQWPFLELLGALMFIAMSCRPDIIYQVSKLAQYCKTCNIGHFRALLHVLRYLKGTLRSSRLHGRIACQREQSPEQDTFVKWNHFLQFTSSEYVSSVNR